MSTSMNLPLSNNQQDNNAIEMEMAPPHAASVAGSRNPLEPGCPMSPVVLSPIVDRGGGYSPTAGGGAEEQNTHGMITISAPVAEANSTNMLMSNTSLGVSTDTTTSLDLLVGDGSPKVIKPANHDHDGSEDTSSGAAEDPDVPKTPTSPMCGPVGKCFVSIFPNGLLPPGSSVASAFTLASCTLGVGTLSVPKAMNDAGGFLGSFFLVLCGAGTIYSVRLLVWAQEITGFNSYEEMSRNLVGRWFERVNSFFIFIFCWGVTVVYISVISDLLGSLQDIEGWPDVFQGAWGRRFMTAIFWVVFMLPLCLTKEIGALRYSSVVGITAITILIITVLVHAAGSDQTAVSNINAANGTTDMILALPAVIFSYGCQTNAFSVYNVPLKNRSVNKMTLVTGISMGICTALYIVIGLAGSMEFGNETKDVILLNYENPTGTAYIMFAYVCMCITLTFAFPVVTFPPRVTVLKTFGFHDHLNAPTWVRLVVSASLATSALVLGMFAPDVSIMFGLLGGVCSSSLSFIWPALFFMRTGKFSAAEVGLGNVICTWIMLVIGVIFGLLGTGVSIYTQVVG